MNMMNSLAGGAPDFLEGLGARSFASGIPVQGMPSARGKGASGVLSPKQFGHTVADAARSGNGLGLGKQFQGMAADMLSLSPETQVTLQYARAQYEVNYQAMQAVSSADGMQMRQVNFSIKASFEFLSYTAGQVPPENGAGGDSAAPVDLMEQLREFFSPEKTAERILDFSLGFFPRSKAFKEGGDTEDSRNQFADVMRDAIQKGFDQALSMLGELPEETAQEIDETHDLVFDGLDRFVTDGLDPDKVSGGVFERIESYQMELRANWQTVKAVSTQGGKTPEGGESPPVHPPLDATA